MRRTTTFLVGAAAAALLAAPLVPSARAATPEEKCEAAKNKAAGKFAACRQAAQAKAIQKGTLPDYAKCDEKFAKRWAKAEAKAAKKGAACPTTGDSAAMQTLLTGHSDTVGVSLAGAGAPVCGDALVNAIGEECDGADLKGKACTDFGYCSGDLACSAGCEFDTGACVGCPISLARSFYLTDANFPTDQALTACAAGYHMASFYEIVNPSHLRYESLHPDAHTKADSGLGPPTQWYGWVRTGRDSSNSATAGMGNCNAWTSASGGDNGVSVRLTRTWETPPGEAGGVWDATSFGCSTPGPVWCVQDPPPEMRRYYLTDASFPTDQPLTACAPGFHMAALYEILDPSALAYDSTHPDAHTKGDSGQGPPTQWYGWVRTGTDASASATAGTGNCNNWSSTSGGDNGVSVRLTANWETPPAEVGGIWDATSFPCSITGPVWCVQD